MTTRNHAAYRCPIFENIGLIILFGDPGAVTIREKEKTSITMEATEILKVGSELNGSADHPRTGNDNNK